MSPELAEFSAILKRENDAVVSTMIFTQGLIASAIYKDLAEIFDLPPEWVAKMLRNIVATIDREKDKTDAPQFAMSYASALEYFARQSDKPSVGLSLINGGKGE